MSVQESNRSLRYPSRAVRFCLAAAVLLWGTTLAHADSASQQAVRARPADIAALNLGLTPSGQGVRIAVTEGEDGIPQLNPPNTNMPAAGVAAGQINVVAGATVHDHATFVDGVIMQRRPAGAPHPGIAPNSILTHAAGTAINQYLLRSQTMMASTGNDARILNWSWSGSVGSSDGTFYDTQWLDWAARTAGGQVQDELIVVAGNSDPTNTRFNPWDNFNGITVGATSTNNYRALALYNGVGGTGVGTQNRTTDASPYGNGRVGRFKTDLVAPGGGDFVVMAGPVIKGGPRDSDNDGLNETFLYGGTSFAAPHVTGAAALLTELGVAKGFNIDHNVIKAVILNGASKTGLTDHDGVWKAEGVQAGVTKSGMGGALQPIKIGWDGDLGTGLLDVSASLVNYNAGQSAPGPADPTGWDYSSLDQVGGNTLATYDLIEGAGGFNRIRASLTWDRVVVLSDIFQTGFTTGLWDTEDKNGNGTLDTGEDLDGDGMIDQETFANQTLDDLDLEIWDLTNNKKLEFSSSDMDSIEHIDLTVPEPLRDHDFAIRVRLFNDFGPSPSIIPYGLAWTAVPEPGTLTLMALSAIAVGLARQRRIGAR